MSGCGTPQGARRFSGRSNRDKTPHGDTHLRTVKKFSENQILDDFHQAAESAVEALRKTDALREPVAVAIDITEDAYWGKGMERTSGTAKVDDVSYRRAHKYATVTIVGNNAPLILGNTPVVPENPYGGRIEKPKHQIVAELMVQALDLVDVHTVLCDREFDAHLVWQVLDNLGVNFLIPKKQYQIELDVAQQLEENLLDIAVEDASIQTAANGHEAELSICYVPTRSKDGTAVFVTNRDVSTDQAQGMWGRYSRRWEIENQYKRQSEDFTAKCLSRDFTVRLFYFTFRCLLYNIWRATDALLKLKLDLELRSSPYLTAGELAEYGSGYLRPIT